MQGQRFMVDPGGPIPMKTGQANCRGPAGSSAVFCVSWVK